MVTRVGALLWCIRHPIQHSVTKNLSPSRLERVQAPEVALIADGVLAIEPDQNFTEEVCRIADATFVED